MPSEARQTSTRVQMADSHLTYIGSSDWRRFNSAVTYDVYQRDGGPQLGWVFRSRGVWTAVSDDLANKSSTGRTRWEAATALWGHSRD